MRILRILLGSVLAVALVSAVTVTPAFAHVALVESNPEDGAKLQAAPTEAVLEFSETLDAPSTKVAVTNSDGDTVDGPAPEIAENTISQPLRLPEKGSYTVAFHIVSEDGHPVRDSITFAVASVPKENRTSQDTKAGDQKSDTTESGNGQSSIGWGTVAAALAVIIVVIVAVGLFMRGRSRC